MKLYVWNTQDKFGYSSRCHPSIEGCLRFLFLYVYEVFHIFWESSNLYHFCFQQSSFYFWRNKKKIYLKLCLLMNLATFLFDVQNLKAIWESEYHFLIISRTSFAFHLKGLFANFFGVDSFFFFQKSLSRKDNFLTVFFFCSALIQAFRFLNSLSLQKIALSFLLISLLRYAISSLWTWRALFHRLSWAVGSMSFFCCCIFDIL